MKKSTHSQLYQKIPPPANLNPEYTRIWSGWNELGNKEVAREASAKGFYVNLAIKFIAVRKGIDFEKAEEWFQNEVLKWFRELLERKQIHRASHILNNINLDATKELTNVFCQTENKELREYIGDHLLKSRKLDSLVKNCWVLLNGIESDENLFLSLAEKQYSLNVNGILNLDCDLKSHIAVALYFKNYDSQLEPLISAKCLWNFLIINDKIDLIKMWINVQYSEKLLDYCNTNFKADVIDSFIGLFKKHRITEELINSLSEQTQKVPLETQNIILNELSRYGVFNSTDSNHFLNLLKRLKNTNSVIRYKQLLQLETSTISIQNFYLQQIAYCLENNLQSVIVSCLLNDQDQEILLSLKEKSNELLRLMDSVNEVTFNLNNLKAIQANVLNVCCYLSCDVFSYFKMYPIILVLLMLFDITLNFIDIIKGVKDVIVLDNLEINLKTMFESLPVLKAISEKFQNKITIIFPTIWNLISNHTTLDTNSVTDFVQSIGSVPHFNCFKVVELYGYKKTINTMYFLKQNQPSRAYRMFFIETTKLQDYNNEGVYLQAENLAIKNFLNINVSAATVAFFEMFGVSSKPLRIHLETIKTIVLNKHSHSDLQYIDENITRFQQVKDNPKIISDILENVIIDSIKSLDAHKDFIDILKKYEIVIRFCRLHGLTLPERLLHLFAVNNLWLQFLIYAQINNYPLHQIRLLVQNFKNPHLLEHIGHSVLHNIDVDALMGKRNTRQSLYSKLGVRKNPKKSSLGEESMKTSTSSLSSYDSTCSSSDSMDTTESELLDMKATLLQTLLRCHNSTDPPKALLQAAQLYRNPLLAVLATSYEPDSVVTNWLVWLGVSCDIYDPAFDYDSMSLCPETVKNFLEEVVQQQYMRTLLESIEIFLPENPLRYFITFLNECVRFKFDSESLKENMTAFYESLKYICSNSIISNMDYEITYLNNKVWIQRVALVLAVTTLEYNFTSCVDQICFVEALCTVEANKILNIEYRFDHLLNILKSIHKLNVEVKLDFSKIYDADDYKIMVHKYLNILITRKEFKEALEIAEMEEINTNNILIEQFKSLATDRVDEMFWKNCSDTFHKYSALPETVIQFFQDFSKKMVNVSYEKYVILKLAYEWAIQSSYSNLSEIEREMWISYINLEENDKTKAFEEVFCTISFAEMKQKLEEIKRIDSYVDINNFTENMNSAISVLLNSGNYWEALKVAKMFAYKHEDLEILKICSSVAEGLMTVDSFNKEQRLLLNSASGVQCRSTSFRSSKISGIYNDLNSGSSLCTAHEIDPVDLLSKNNLYTLQRLIEKLKSGYTLGQNIFMMYRISVNIEIPYAVLLENDDDEKLLKDALDDNCRNKLEVIHDFITVYKWSRIKVTDFICEELINTVNDYIKTKHANLMMWDVNLDNEFHLILQLFQENCSLLGMKLFAYSKAIQMSQSLENEELYRISELALVVELLIRAHDCFTADCNMEGIATVLKKSQTLIALLLQLQSWKLIVRLLTGIRRYTEMEYVFQILRENEQFEFLLNRGSKKDNSLKLALLDYLKKYCPDNRELYRIVALHFTLFSEVAHLWELEAESVVRNLITISKLEMENNGLNPALEPFVLFSGTEGTKICLHKAMTNFSHASQYHLHGEKLSKAMHSAKQAELIALQISRLKNLPTNGTTICLMHLNSVQINELLVKHLSFPQALIVIEAYDYKPDWASILYEQCVINGRIDYLQQFMDNFLLSDHLVHDISRKFLKTKHDAAAVNSMKEILMRISSVLIKYKVASELGFSDILEDLLAEDKVAYLKDTVWKRGFRN